MSEPPTQPARITRRSFVKRTSATVIVTVLALHAFRNEARAETVSASGSFTLEYQSDVPKFPYTFEIGKVAGIDKDNLATKYRVYCEVTLTAPATAPQNTDQKTAWQFDILATIKADISNSVTIKGPAGHCTLAKKLSSPANSTALDYTGSGGNGEVPGPLGNNSTTTIPCKILTGHIEDGFTIKCTVPGIDGAEQKTLDISLVLATPRPPTP